MKEVFITRKLFGKKDEPQFGSWWEKGHSEMKFMLDRYGKDAYSILLTREEWNEIQGQLDELNVWKDRSHF